MKTYEITQYGWVGRSATSPEASRIDHLALEREARQLRDESLAQGLGAFGRAVRTLARRFVEWRERRETYSELMRLDDRMLADIGLNRGELRAVSEMGQTPSRTRETLVDFGGNATEAYFSHAANRNEPYKAA